MSKFPEFHDIGVLSLRSANIKQDLASFCSLWKTQYAKNLLEMARGDLDVLVEYINDTSRKFSMEIDHLDSVRKLVALLREVRERDSNIEWDVRPLEEKYDMLQRYGVKSLNQEELHQVPSPNTRFCCCGVQIHFLCPSLIFVSSPP